MATRTHAGETRPDQRPDQRPDHRPNHRTDPEIDFAGYDPYIVALTGAASSSLSHPSSTNSEESTASRKVKLMAWLREHNS